MGEWECGGVGVWGNGRVWEWESVGVGSGGVCSRGVGE